MFLCFLLIINNPGVVTAVNIIFCRDRFSLLTMASLQLSACAPSVAGLMKCFGMNGPYVL